MDSLNTAKLNDNQLRYIRSQPEAWQVILHHLHAFRSQTYRDFILSTVGNYKQGLQPVYPLYRLPLCSINIYIRYCKISPDQLFKLVSDNATYATTFDKTKPVVSYALLTNSDKTMMAHVQFTADCILDFKGIRTLLGYCDIYPVYSIADAHQQVLLQAPDTARQTGEFRSDFVSFSDIQPTECSPLFGDYEPIKNCQQLLEQLAESQPKKKIKP